jgi:hypothetical protein
MAGPFLLITWGEEEISSGLTGILVGSAPIFTALLAARGYADEPLGRWGAIGVVVGIAGVVLLFASDLSGDTGQLFGGTLVLLAGVGYAVGGLTIKSRMADVPPIGVASATMVGFRGGHRGARRGRAAVERGHGLRLGAPGPRRPRHGPGLPALLHAAGGDRRAARLRRRLPGLGVLRPLRRRPARRGRDAGSLAGLALILFGSYVAAQRRLPWSRRVSRTAPSRSSAPEPVRAR